MTDKLLSKLYLDDIRNPPDDTWLLVRNYDECIAALQKQDWNIISLDHDLADFHYGQVGGYGEGTIEKTGYSVAEWMVENNVYAKEDIIIHSWNPDGARRMGYLLGKNKPDNVRVWKEPAKSCP